MIKIVIKESTLRLNYEKITLKKTFLIKTPRAFKLNSYFTIFNYQPNLGFKCYPNNNYSKYF